MADLPTHILRLSDLPAGRSRDFTLAPTAADCDALAADLGIPALRKLRFDGTLSPKGRGDWRLDATLGATAELTCSVTGVPLTWRIDDPVERIYVANWQEPEAHEIEMPDDTASEPMPTTLDLYEVVHEALILALPAYPRADGAELGEAQFSPDGTAPMTDEDAKPFAGLGALLAQSDAETDTDS